MRARSSAPTPGATGSRPTTDARGAPPPALHPANRGFEWQNRRGPFRLLTASQAAQFDEEGFVLLRGALDLDRLGEVEAELDRYEAKAQRWLERQPGRRAGISSADGLTFAVHLVARSSIARDFASSEPFASLCADLVGPDVRLYWDQAVYKQPEMAKPFPWHQDNGYTFIEPQAYLTCWVPLTDATIDNGCPWVWPGAHRWGTLEHRPSELGHVCKDDDVEAVPIAARPGDIVVFSSLTPHRTGPNTTAAVRKAYILQYAPDGARLLDGTRCDAEERQFLVLRRGQPAQP